MTQEFEAQEFKAGELVAGELMAGEFEARQRRQRTYSREEVGDVIRLATELEHMTSKHKAQLREGLSYDQLVEVAAELGISEDAVVRALLQSEQTAAPPPRKKIERNSRAGFVRHFWVYVSVMAGLSVIDLADGSGGLDWVWFPAAGWGIAVLIHSRVFFTD